MGKYLKKFTNYNKYDAYLKSNNYLVPNVSSINSEIYYGDSYRITIHYLYGNGTKALDDFVILKKPGQEYNIQSPSIDGYVPNWSYVSGTVSKNQTYTILYMPNTNLDPIDDGDEPIII